jgi:hypothetical protein
MSKIIVKAKAERGFYRAGLHFTRAGVELDTGKLKKKDLEAILAEPNLVVVTDDAADAKEAKRLAAEQAQKDKDALAREKKAIKADAKSWEAAAAEAQKATEVAGEDWAALTDSARVERIEAAAAAAASEPKA